MWWMICGCFLGGRFYTTVQKGVMRLQCQMRPQAVVAPSNNVAIAIPNQTARASKTGEWGSNSAFWACGLRMSLARRRRISGSGETIGRANTTCRPDFNVDGLKYRVERQWKQIYCFGPDFSAGGAARGFVRPQAGRIQFGHFCLWISHWPPFRRMDPQQAGRLPRGRLSILLHPRILIRRRGRKLSSSPASPDTESSTPKAGA